MIISCGRSVSKNHTIQSRDKKRSQNRKESSQDSQITVFSENIFESNFSDPILVTTISNSLKVKAFKIVSRENLGAQSCLRLGTS